MSEKTTHEYIFRCTKCGGNMHVQAKDQEQANDWLKNQSGFCPTGGNHVELSFEGYFEYVEESPEISRIPTKEEQFKATIQEMLEKAKNGTALLTAGDIGIPTIHDIKKADHCGFGFFESKYDKDGNPLPAGKSVDFDGGAAMKQAPSPIYGWSYFGGATKEWGYPFEQVIQRLSNLLTMKPEDV